MKTRIFTDGACSGNPGPGGWAAIITFSEKYKILSGNEVNTTNNRMELLSVVMALFKIINEYRNECDEITIVSDSAYVVNAINKNWLKLWKSKGWNTSQDKPIKNADLWKKLDNLLDLFEVIEIKVNFEKVKGHSGNYFNELVDKKAREEVNIIKKKEGIM